MGDLWGHLKHGETEIFWGHLKHWEISFLGTAYNSAVFSPTKAGATKNIGKTHFGGLAIIQQCFPQQKRGPLKTLGNPILGAGYNSVVFSPTKAGAT